MFDFLSKLFDTSDFPARWQCGNWTAGLGWLHILSDLAVWSAYVAIPLVLGYFAYRRKDIPFRGFFVLFGSLLQCATLRLKVHSLCNSTRRWLYAYRSRSPLSGLLPVCPVGTG